MSTSLPIEEAFATGRRNETLVLMVCAGWLWAGLYRHHPAGAPAEVSASTARSVIARPKCLQLGTGRFALTPRSLQRACRWLDRQGVSVRKQTQ